MPTGSIRLASDEIDAICTAFRQFFLPEDRLWIFGSRVDPTARGGDIDLYIETHLQDAGACVGAKISFVTELYEKIGEQKIDVVLNLLSSNYKLFIYEVARTEGIQLV